MQLVVKMSDKEYQEYQEFVKNKKEYIKKDDINLRDVLNKDFDIVDKNIMEVPFRCADVLYRHKTKRTEVVVRYYE